MPPRNRTAPAPQPDEHTTPTGPAAPDPSPEPLITPAAPLEPPTIPPPAEPPATPGPPLRHTVMPGAEFSDVLGEDGDPVDPDQMFIDDGPAHATYVRAAQRLTRRHRYLGANRFSTQVLYNAGRRVDKAEAAALRAEVEQLRAAQAAAPPPK
ncbi:hypothetical protein GCM10017673_38060 [Streptosporangium violaceochromogenes]|nr:hypothetical protein GCM10017673_38060 [Streptosporangium violaceochromogenes]